MAKAFSVASWIVEQQVAKVAASQWSWLLSTWVPRALENALLTYSTRILKREMRLAG